MEKELKGAIRLEPRSAPAYANLADLYRAGGRDTDGERATRLEPNDARFAYVHGVALHSTGKVETAIERLEKTLTAHPNNRDILEALASFQRARGRIAEATQYEERLRALSATE